MRKRVIMGFAILMILVFSVSAATRIFHVQETEFVKINVTALDPDYDKIVYNFSEPLDQDGEWQTNYGDAGEYDVKITASDGSDTSMKDIKIIVDKKNREPILIKNELKVSEGDVVDLKKLVEDPDGDTLFYTFPTPFNNNGEWIPSYDDAGLYIFEFSISDEKIKKSAKVKVVVEEKNQPPEITHFFTLGEVNEGEFLKYFIDVKDGDGDKVSYKWMWDGAEISSHKTDSLHIGFDDSGEHTLEVFVSDGTNTISHEWNVDVKNTNRKPVLEDISITIKEGETATFTLPETDLDGDSLTYIFDEPFNRDGTWQTNFDDHGTYFIYITGTDGEFTTTFVGTVHVTNVDRKPSITLEAHYWVSLILQFITHPREVFLMEPHLFGSRVMMQLQEEGVF
jgi:hypothetical protein